MKTIMTWCLDLFLPLNPRYWLYNMMEQKQYILGEEGVRIKLIEAEGLIRTEIGECCTLEMRRDTV